MVVGSADTLPDVVVEAMFVLHLMVHDPGDV